MKRLVALALAALLSGCAGSQTANESAPHMMQAGGRAAAVAPAQTERKIIRRADLIVEVEDLEAAAEQAEQTVANRGGLLESAHEIADSSTRLVFRVPADSLEAVLDELRALGTVERSSVSSRDVSEQHADLAVRLDNSRKLRDRLKTLLERANTVKEILAVEKELARVQTDVERLQGQLERLDSQVAMSNLSLTLKRKRILGPLGYLGYGIYWVIGKLFVIR
jgi:hypothetical protein